MFFTNKTRFTPKPIKFGEFCLQPQSKVRWLGFWLDPKLRFHHHITNMRATGISAIHQLRRLSKCFSGLNPEATQNLVISILRSKILFGSVVWLTLDTSKKVFDIWDKLLNTANRLVLGAFKTSPTELMQHDSHLTLFRLTATRLHYNFYCRCFTAPNDHPTKRFILHELQTQPRSHHSCISRRIEPDFMTQVFPNNYETIYPHLNPPWTQKTGSIHNLEIKRDEAKKLVQKRWRCDDFLHRRLFHPE